MNKKLCVITGATSGIGWAAAHQIAAKNYDLIVVGRDAQKGEELKTSILKQSPDCQFHYYVADLANMNQVKAVVASIRQLTNRIDALINNAGGVFSHFNVTDIGVEQTLANNHLSYFVFTHGLLDLVKASNDGRIIIVSSGTHYKVSLNFESFTAKKNYNIMRAYAQSKLANVLFAYKLTRLLKGSNVSTFVLHPGFVRTPIGGKSTYWLHILVWKLATKFSIRKRIWPDESAKTYTYLATNIESKAHNGVYFHDGVIQRSSEESYNVALQDKLWKWSEEVTGVKYEVPENS